MRCLLIDCFRRYCARVARTMNRVAVYIDGFNLYFGQKSKRKGQRGSNWPCYHWLDIRKLSEKLINQDQRLEMVRYFTARVRGNPRKAKRQNTYIGALETLPGVQIHEGYSLIKQKTCNKCGGTFRDYEEKKTDVNIAVELLGDAQDGLYDTAIVVSADSDLVGPVEAVLRRYSDKKVIVAFPPDRHSANLEAVASDHLQIDQNDVRTSQLPSRIRNRAGYRLKRPVEWN